MRNIAITLGIILGFNAIAQEVIKGKESDINITPILHSTMVIEWDGFVIIVDPYGGAQGLMAYEPADLILITHQHQDHFNKETLLELNFEDSRVIAPKVVIDELDTLDFQEKISMANGETKMVDRIKIEAVPMYNLPEGSGGHKKGVGNGYILTIDGKRIYISGDTEDIPEMKQLKNIDAAFICMNLPYTMTEEQAAEAVLAFKPKVVYPFHYRGKEKMSDPEKFKKLVNEKNKNIEVRLLDWYPEKPKEE